MVLGGSLIIDLKGMRRMMFQLSGFYYNWGVFKVYGSLGFRGFACFRFQIPG